MEGYPVPPPYPENLEKAIAGVEARLAQVAIQRAKIDAEWDELQLLRTDYKYEQVRRNNGTSKSV